MHEFGKKQRKKLFILIFVDTIQQFQLITMINDVCFMQKSMILSLFITSQQHLSVDVAHFWIGTTDTDTINVLPLLQHLHIL